MHDLAAFSLSLLGFSLLHAAVPARFPFALAAKRHAYWPRSLRIAAMLFSGLSLCLWAGGSGWLLGSIFFVLSWVLAGSAFTITASIAPRLVWALAVFLPAVSALGVLLGGPHAP